MRLHGGFFGWGAGRMIGVLATVAAACCMAPSPAAAASKVINTIGVGSDPSGVSSDGTHVWVTNISENTVSEIDAATGKVINTIGVGSHPVGVSSDGTHLWVTSTSENTVSEIEAPTGTVINTIDVGSFPYGASSDGTHVWVTNEGQDTVSETAINASAIKCSKLYGGPTNVTFGLCKPSAGKGYTRLRGAISGLQVGATGFTWSPRGATTEIEVTSVTAEHHEACNAGRLEELITGEVKAASTTGAGIPAVGETFSATICKNPKTHKVRLVEGTYVEL